MKLKRAASYDLEVIGLEEGQGKYQFMTGKLICRWINGTTINVGSGLSDEQRAQWWANRSDIIGKIVQVDAMSLSAKGQLREPVFKCVRLIRYQEILAAKNQNCVQPVRQTVLKIKIPCNVKVRATGFSYSYSDLRATKTACNHQDIFQPALQLRSQQQSPKLYPGFRASAVPSAGV